jgi:hypothetical protein
MPATGVAVLLLLLLVAQAAAAAQADPASPAPAPAPAASSSPPPPRWRLRSPFGGGNWRSRRRRRGVELADAVIAGAARDAKESAGAPSAGGGGGGDSDNAPPSRTQAGCPCLARWEYGGALAYRGCANPNRDPLGYWCAVDGATCPGYYGALGFPSTSAPSSQQRQQQQTTQQQTQQQQQLVAYDYCVGTDGLGVYWPGPRERTTHGCLCQAGRWSLALPGGGGALGPAVPAGKGAYHDRCARPGGPGTPRRCVVDVRTCPDPQALAAAAAAAASFSAADAGVVDTCPPLDDGLGGGDDSSSSKSKSSSSKRASPTPTPPSPETAAAEKELRAAAGYFASAPPRSHRTIGGCACAPGGWRYRYPGGRETELLEGCHNPDGDPLGPWCAVDPKACAWFSGEIRGGGGDGGGGGAGGGRKEEGAQEPQEEAVLAFDYCRLPSDAAERDPLAARPSRRAAALAEAAREEVARTADLLAAQREAVRAAIDARGAAWLDAAAAGALEAAAVLEGAGGNAAAAAAAAGDRSWAALPPSSCRLEQLAPWAQCGGKSACGDWACADAAWPGRCCPVGHVCERQHASFWQCVPPLAAASFGGDAAEAGAAVAAAVAGGRGPSSSSSSSSAEEDAAARRRCDPAARREREAREAEALAAGRDPPAYPFPLPALLPATAQCGGLADCPDGVRGSAGCGDRPWPGFCCPGGSACRRQRGNPWYWQCLPQREDGPAEGAVPPSLFGGDGDGAGGLRPPVSEPGPTLAAPPPLPALAASGLALEPESGAAQAPESLGLSPGRTFVVSMRLAGDYGALLLPAADAASSQPSSSSSSSAAAAAGDPADPADLATASSAAPPALRALKAGLVEAVVAAAAAASAPASASAGARPGGLLYRVEVTSLAPGSIVADVSATFAAEAGEAGASAAFERLRAGVGPAYAASALPARFGALEALTISAQPSGGAGPLVPLARGVGGGGGGGGGGQASWAAARRSGGGKGASRLASSSKRAAPSAPRAGPGVDADAAFGRRKTVGALSPGAAAGVAVAGLAGLAAAGYAVSRGVAARGGGGAAAGDGGGGKEEEEQAAAGGGGGAGSRPLAAWPLRSPRAASPASPPPAPAPAAAGAFLQRGASEGGGGGGASDVAAYATAVPAPSGTVVSRRGSKNAA